MNNIDGCHYADGDMIGYAICNNHPPESMQRALEDKHDVPYAIIITQGLPHYVLDYTSAGVMGFILRHQTLPLARTAQGYIEKMKAPQSR